MAHRLPTITQPAIARALREAKKQGCELMEIKPTGELLIYLKPGIGVSNTAMHPDNFWDFLNDDTPEIIL
ncbi:hypothetical protein ACMY46_00080 [Bartonella bacilliformis]|uniref:hypothetical protein n=1 Tax=Bartonella bacilliformis TaxID=774 RepID=UPI0004A0CDB1|nr:hypothetical protein [Bartonella bacilliformis]KEG17117.1 hypothetical protein H705_01011 [Bartonella bacilliformis Cond044]